MNVNEYLIGIQDFNFEQCIGNSSSAYTRILSPSYKTKQSFHDTVNEDSNIDSDMQEIINEQGDDYQSDDIFNLLDKCSSNNNNIDRSRGLVVLQQQLQSLSPPSSQRSLQQAGKQSSNNRREVKVEQEREGGVKVVKVHAKQAEIIAQSSQHLNIPCFSSISSFSPRISQKGSSSYSQRFREMSEHLPMFRSCDRQRQPPNKQGDRNNFMKKCNNAEKQQPCQRFNCDEQFKGNTQVMEAHFKLSQLLLQSRCQPKDPSSTQNNEIPFSSHHSQSPKRASLANQGTSSFRSISRDQGRSHYQQLAKKLSDREYPVVFHAIDKHIPTAELKNGRYLHPLLLLDGRQSLPIQEQDCDYDIESGLKTSKYGRVMTAHISETDSSRGKKLVFPRNNNNQDSSQNRNEQQEEEHHSSYNNNKDSNSKQEGPFNMKEGRLGGSTNKNRKLQQRQELSSIQEKQRQQNKRLRMFARFEKSFVNICQQLLDPNKVQF